MAANIFSRFPATALLLVICQLGLLYSGAAKAVVMDHPADSTVTEGSWANFTCTANCDFFDSVFWYIGDHSQVRTVSNNPFYINLLESRAGIRVNLQTLSECGTGVTMYEQRLQVWASLELNRTAVQCVAAKRTNPVLTSRFYSRYAILRVESLSDSISNLSSPAANCSSPSPSPVEQIIQPTATVVTSITVTRVVTVTATKILTVTETVIPTPEPCDITLTNLSSASKALWDHLRHPILSLLLFALLPLSLWL